MQQAFDVEKERLRDAADCLRSGKRHFSHQEHSYLARSRYEIQLQRYLMLFPFSQLLIIRSEDFFEDPQSVWNSILIFLSLDMVDLPSVAVANSGQRDCSIITKSLRNELRAKLQPTYSFMSDYYDVQW